MNIVAHNLSAMNAQRQFGINTRSKAKSTEKLSSGYKINRAADDAAGLAISEKMRRQIRGLTQGVENTQDGVSLCQVADGALAEVNDMLHRITELSVKAANGTNTEEDRQAIQEEINQILKEIDRIGDTTTFNEQKIFSGGEAKSTYLPLTVGKLAVSGTTTDATAMTYSITANNSGFSINGDTFSWSEFTDGTNTLADTPITGGTYSFDYHGFTLSFDVENNANKNDLVGRLNGASFATKEGSYTYKQKAIGGELNEDIGVSSPLPSNGKLKISVDNNKQIWLKNEAGDVYSGYNLANVACKDNYYAGDRQLLNITDGGNGLIGPSIYIEFLEDTTKEEYLDMVDGATVYFDTSSVTYNSSLDKYFFKATTLELTPAKVKSSGIELSQVKQTNYKGVEVPPTQTDIDTAPLNLWIQSGCEAGHGMWLEIDRMNTSILGINDLDASTVDGANHAMEAVKGALQNISANRSKIGAQQNRLEHTIANEENVVENTTAAESRIRDTDMAKEMVRFSNINILEQAGHAMMAQANQSNQGVLSLLQ